MELTVVPVYPGGEPSGGPTGSPGRYEVVFVLAVPGTAVATRRVDFGELRRSGDSLLEIGNREIRITKTSGDGRAELTASLQPNSNGHLARAVIQLDAANFEVAHQEAYDYVLPLLSRYAFDYEMAIDWSHCLLTHLPSETRRCIVSLLGQSKKFDGDVAEKVSTPEERALLSSYREGVGSLNAFYAALSYAKVIEGVRRLRVRDARAAARSGTVALVTPEVMPTSGDDLPPPFNDQWHADGFAPFLGKAFEVVYDESLREPIRNALSHLDPVASTTLSIDRLADYKACERHVPVLHYMARAMLSNQFGAPYLPGRGA